MAALHICSLPSLVCLYIVGLLPSLARLMTIVGCGRCNGTGINRLQKKCLDCGGVGVRERGHIGELRMSSAEVSRLTSAIREAMGAGVSAEAHRILEDSLLDASDD